MHESKPTLSSALSEEVRIAMSKFVKSLASFCSLDKVDLGDLVKKQESSVGQNLTGKLDFVLADQPYDLRRDLNNYCADFDVFGSNGINDMVKLLGDVINPESHEHVFCSTLRFSFWIKALALEQ